MKYYVDPRATKLQRTVNHLHDDLELGQRAIPEIAERMRKEFGVAVDVAVMKLARVSEPTVVAIGGSDTVKEIEGGKSNRKKS